MLFDNNGIFTDVTEQGNDDEMYHYGTPRHSGRYPWGSGENPYQRNENFLKSVDELKKKGFTEKQIAEGMGMNTSELRKRKSLANAENRAYLSAEAKRLKAKGMSTSAIARRMGRNESSVRLLLDEGLNERMGTVAKNATILKERVNNLDYIDVGKGSEQYLGITSHSLGNALHILEEQGYTLHDIPVEQLGTGKQTTIKVLAKPGVDWKEVYDNRSNIKMVTDVYSDDGGETMRPLKEYVSVDKNRVGVRYAEDGGEAKDGVIELRRNVDDISLNKARYAQVRILIDGTHYAKGMAMYSDDMPEGVDILINTNKKRGTPLLSDDPNAKQVLKVADSKGENPFGANIKPDDKITRAQSHYTDKDGVEHQSALNIVSEEGTWNDWNRTLSSQFLSKQSPALAKQQLQMAYDIAKADFDEIASYSNPTVKAKLLEDFAGRCESDAVHLQAAALPRQSTRVILPLTEISDKEIYLPGGDYRDGEQVALVRYPHAGHFEIPVLTVNKENKQGLSTIGDAIDAVGISKKTADRLSGADFDGDTVLVLPVNDIRIKATANNRPAAFRSLEDFNPKEEYRGYDGMHVMTPHEKGIEMGKITNLITDATFQGATNEEICRMVKHSMVVIDAEKHKLDYKRSEAENGIAELKAKYQSGGASTLLSRSTSEYQVPERREKSFGKMSEEEKKRYLNGEIIYRETGRTWDKPDYLKSRMTKEERVMWDSGDDDLVRQVKSAMIADGRVRIKKIGFTETSTLGREKDPYSLVSGGSREKTTPIERIYADHAVAMKELAREARKLAREQKDIERNPEAAKKYAAEVDSLNAKLSVALRNAPLERQAQLLANKKLDQIIFDNPELKKDKEHYKREKGRQLEAARKAVGAKKLTIGGSSKNPLTDREWEAIQAGAITKTTLKRILQNADTDRVRELAMPRTKTGLSSAKVARAKAMIAKGYSRADICDMLDISESKLINAIGIENL